MLARLVLSVVFATSLTACGDKEVKGTPTPGPKEAPKKLDPPSTTTGTPAASSGADDIVMDEGPEDRSCDPKDKGACLEGESCVGKTGCEAVWECEADITCKKGMREYCGCDGKTFESEYGNCPQQKYQYAGPCK